MATTTTIQVELTYTDYDTRKYNIPIDTEPEDYDERAKTAIRNFNTAASTEGSSIQQTFLSEGGAPVARINSAIVIERTEEVLYGG